MSYSCNDNQNYFVSETGRTTSRVLNPPGGASSFTLGADDSASQRGRAAAADNTSNGPTGALLCDSSLLQIVTFPARAALLPLGTRIKASFIAGVFLVPTRHRRPVKS
jgi:hypothetical protein